MAVRVCAPAVVALAAVGAVCINGPPSGPIAKVQGVDAAPVLVWQVPRGAEVYDFGSPSNIAPLIEGSRIVLATPGADAIPQVLTIGFTAVGQPDLSFDARRILFAGRKEDAAKLGIFELDLRTGEARIVVECVTPCDRAVYLSTLYTLDAPAPVQQIAFRAQDFGLGSPQLFRCRPDGADVQQITFAPGGVADPLLVSDGRLAFSAVAPADTAPSSATVFLTINTDGTDVFPFAGQRDASAMRSSPVETAGGRVIFLERESASAARIASVRTARSLSSRELVVAGVGDALAVSPLADGHYLVSRRDGQGTDYGIYVVEHGSENGIFDRYFDSAEYHDLTATPVGPRPRPPGRSTVVDPNVAIGQLYCLSAYLSDITGSQEKGANIARVRVYPRGSEETSHAALGDLDVEQDGSFFAELPARTPLQLETLDAQGNSLQRMRSWFWIMPKERRGCIGCHEDRELAPPNRHVFALRKLPQRLGTSAAATLAKDE